MSLPGEEFAAFATATGASRTALKRSAVLPAIRVNESVTLNRVVDQPAAWRWGRAKPVGILITEDGTDLAAFLTNPTHTATALSRIEVAMTIAQQAYDQDPTMEDDLNAISDEVLDTILNTDIGHERIERERTEGRQEAEARIYRQLLQVMPEAQARQITGYTGS